MYSFTALVLTVLIVGNIAYVTLLSQAVLRRYRDSYQVCHLIGWWAVWSWALTIWVIPLYCPVWLFLSMSIFSTVLVYRWIMFPEIRRYVYGVELPTRVDRLKPPDDWMDN